MCLFCVPILGLLWRVGVFTAVHRLSLVLVPGDFSPAVVHGLLLFQSTGSRARGLQSLWPTDSVAQQHVGS